jgi:hypothetical protein
VPVGNQANVVTSYKSLWTALTGCKMIPLISDRVKKMSGADFWPNTAG